MLPVIIDMIPSLAVAFVLAIVLGLGAAALHEWIVKGKEQ